MAVQNNKLPNPGRELISMKRGGLSGPSSRHAWLPQPQNLASRIMSFGGCLAFGYLVERELTGTHLFFCWGVPT